MLRWNFLWFGRKQMMRKNTWFWNEWDILLANCTTLPVSLKSFSVSWDRAARPDVLNFSFRRILFVLRTAGNCKYLQSLQSITIERICTSTFVRNSCRAYNTQVNSVFRVHWLNNWEVNSKVLFTSELPRRNDRNCTFFANYRVPDRRKLEVVRFVLIWSRELTCECVRSW